MKKLIAFTMFFAFSFVLFAQEPAKQVTTVEPAKTIEPVKSPEPKAAFKWVETTHDFGNIPQGKPTTAEFKFTNTGKAPLILTNVRGSCGCTTTDYSKDPIPPGKTGFVKATYNAANMGNFTKTVTVTANTESGSEVLYIKGGVIANPTTPPQGPN